MKKAVIKVRLAYDFPDDKSISEIMTDIENIELPKEYDEDSFEWFGIYDEEKDKLIPYYDFPMLDIKKPMNELDV